MNLKKKIVTIMFLLFCPVGVWAQNEAANTGRITLDVEVLDNLGFDTVTEIVTLQHATASEVEPLISNRLSRYGVVQVNDALNMLIITDKPLKVKDLAELARKLDTPGMRNFLRLETESIGLKYTKAEIVKPLLLSRLSAEGSIVVDVDHNSLVITDVKSRIENLKKVIAFLDSIIQQVQIEIKLVEMAETDFNQIGKTGKLEQILKADVTDSFEFQHSRKKQETVSGKEPSSGKPSDKPAAEPVTTKSYANLLQAKGQLAVNLGQLVDNYYIDVSQAKLLYAPSIITTNNTVGTFSWNDAQGYQVTLDILPYIGTQKNITLDVHAKVVSPSDKGANVGEVRNSIVVRDGDTFVMGGWTRTNISTSKSGNPWLSWIPLIGRLFKEDIKMHGQNRVVALITPRILEINPPTEVQLGAVKSLEEGMPPK